ncbi:MAG: J domain-containing protein [Acidobacteria bacterium]|nr:J domain-containing protein [Acidobacteriota bacterium]
MQGDARARCLETLGLAPGAAAQEIKAAYRDLAKVWHPDRFTHEPRLQQKAQEKLKAINDAYQQLLTGRYSAPKAPDAEDGCGRRRHAAPPQPGRPAQTEPHAQTGPRARRRDFDWRWLAPALVFCATFAFLTPRLLSSNRPHANATAEPAAESARESPGESEPQTTADGAAAKDAQGLKLQETRQRPAATRPDGEAHGEAVAAATPHLRALPTVTVSIDPANGLRARPACPNKTAMTFPAGDEPSGYCTAPHRAEVSGAATADERAGQPKQARLRSFADRLASPSKWLPGKDGGAARADQKPAPADAAVRN